MFKCILYDFTFNNVLYYLFKEVINGSKLLFAMIKEKSLSADYLVVAIIYSDIFTYWPVKCTGTGKYTVQNVHKARLLMRQPF